MAGVGGYDVVIVGGGAAGAVVARRLAEHGDRSILLLEAGPDLRADIPPAFRDGWNLPEIPDSSTTASRRAWHARSQAEGRLAVRGRAS